MTNTESLFSGNISIAQGLGQLRTRLLDLTGRNRLLNFRHTAGRSLQFVSANPAAIFQRLVVASGSQKVLIAPVPDPAPELWNEKNGRLAPPDAREHASFLGINTTFELPTGAQLLASEETGQQARALYYGEDLGKHCRKLEREARLAIEETGANMLYLVVGFLEFPDAKDSDRLFQAPLICIPVRFEVSTDGRYTNYRLAFTGEEVAENLSLREKIKRDYQLTLPSFPEDIETIETYLKDVQEVIAHLPRWKVRNMLSLALLSFANMLLVRDLEPQRWLSNDGKSQLLEHALIKRVFQGSTGGRDIAYSPEYDVDNHEHENLAVVFDADSSQHSALIDVLKGRSMVIEGPPGTGKSQTITNIIASCLHHGKSVLFVAEKLAALEVVKSNLTRAGLDPFLLELHSNKTSKKSVIEDLEKRILFRPIPPRGIDELEAGLLAKKKELKEHANLLSSVVGNQMGCSIRQIMWRAERHRVKLRELADVSKSIMVEFAPTTTENAYNALVDQVGYLAKHYQEVGAYDASHPFWGFFPMQLQPGDDLKIGRLLNDVQPTLVALESCLRGLEGIVGANGHSMLTMKAGAETHKTLTTLAAKLDSAAAVELLPRLFPGSDTQTQRAVSAVQRGEQLLSSIAELHAQISGRIDEGTVNDDTSARLSDHQNTVTIYGLGDRSPAEISDLSSKLAQTCERALAALATIQQFAQEIGLSIADTHVGVQAFETILQEAARAPDRSLRFRHTGLVDPDARAILKRAMSERLQLLAAQQALDGVLYLDEPTQEQPLRDAITTLREGPQWYRFIQKRWRQAVAFHRGLEKDKSKKSSGERLNDLEALQNLQKRKRDWDSNESTKVVCGEFYRGMNSPFADLILVADWLQKTRENLDAAMVPIELFDPVTINQQHLARLRSVEADAKESIATLKSVDTTVRESFPVVPAGTTSVQPRSTWTAHLEELRAVASKLNELAAFFSITARKAMTVSECATLLRASVQMRSKEIQLRKSVDLEALLGDRFSDLPTHLVAIKNAVAFGQAVKAAKLPGAVEVLLLQPRVHMALADLIERFRTFVDQSSTYAEFESNIGQFGDFSRPRWADATRLTPSAFVHSLLERCSMALNSLDRLVPWSHYIFARSEAKSIGLDRFTELLENDAVPPDALRSTFSYRYYASLAQSIFHQQPALARFSGTRHSTVRAEFGDLDRRLIQQRGRQIAAHCVRNAAPPEGVNGARVDDKTEMSLVRLLIPQTRPRVAVRKLLARAGAAIQALKPCFMMGPQAVAQFLHPGGLQFDVVVMDEASQLRPEEAIGAIARGSQLIVVGDPKQLPPTSFFARGQATDDEEGAMAVVDSESILDVAISHFQPVRSLRWHYRSRHQSLIAFSNQEFYRGNLIVFPSPYPQGSILGVRYHYVRDAVYEDQLNPKEAQRVVDFVVTHITTTPGQSLGIVTLNTRQRDLIAELLEDRLKTVPGAEAFRENWEKQGFRMFVKNLENVQGDERDTIIISTTFGRPPGASKPRQNFGPISRDGGWRRLNVLFTRARCAVLLVTSMRPEDVIADHRTPLGTQALHNYLDYACNGRLRHVPEVPTGLTPDSDFEESVIGVLNDAGYETTPQLGVAGFRIDIGVKHPDHPSLYLAGIECDGAAYHSGVSIRDRDRIRQEILESLGWKGRLWRIWSTDWFRNPRPELAKLVSFLKDRRAELVDAAFTAVAEQGDQADATDIGETLVGAKATATAAEGLLVTEIGEHEIEVGDLISYVDIDQDANAIITMRITEKIQDVSAGLIAQHTPLAQALLGAMVGDAVVLRVPGHQSRPLEIKAIKKPNTGSTKRPEG